MYYHRQQSFDGNTYVNTKKEKGLVTLIHNHNLIRILSSVVKKKTIIGIIIDKDLLMVIYTLIVKKKRE